MRKILIAAAALLLGVAVFAQNQEGKKPQQYKFSKEDIEQFRHYINPYQLQELFFQVVQKFQLDLEYLLFYQRHL